MWKGKVADREVCSMSWAPGEVVITSTKYNYRISPNKRRSAYLSYKLITEAIIRG